MRRQIHEYIHERFEAKVEKLKPSEKEGDAEKYEKQEAKYIPQVWLASAAKLVSQIQVVTHPVKATHSRIKINQASSLYVRPANIGCTHVVNSALMGNNFKEDVTGGAAALY